MANVHTTLTETEADARAAVLARKPRQWVLPALAVLAGPATAAAQATNNAVVIDFDQGRLILGWIGLWLVAALTFAACADKRIRLMTRLHDYLQQRALRRARERADDALLLLARDDPRILADLFAARDHAQADAVPAQAAPAHAEAAPVRPASPGPARTGRRSPARGFRTAPLPGLPRHLQYLPG